MTGWTLPQHHAAGTLLHTLTGTLWSLTHSDPSGHATDALGAVIAVREALDHAARKHHPHAPRRLYFRGQPAPGAWADLDHLAAGLDQLVAVIRLSGGHRAHVHGHAESARRHVAHLRKLADGRGCRCHLIRER